MRTVPFNGKAHKVFTYTGEFGSQDVILVEEKYVVGGALAILLMCVDGDVVTEPFTTLTVCLGPLGGEDGVALVDVNNNPEAKRFIRENKLGRDTGRRLSSGYCVYPLYEFFTDKFYK